MILQVQDYLQVFSDPEEALALLAENGDSPIKVTRSDGLVCLNYSIVKRITEIGNECRGLILSVPEFDVVSFSFRRFFNYGEGHAADIDWPTAVVQQKLDGSLVVFYYHDGAWHVQTRGMPDAGGRVPAGRYTFHERIDALLQSQGLSVQSLCAGLPIHCCVVCEYVGPYNRIVTHYENEDLYLLTLTDKQECRDMPEPKEWRWPFSRPQVYPMVDSLKMLIDMVQELPPLEEGYVVVDGKGNRIKVKNPAHLAIAHTINAGGGCTDRHFARMALAGDCEEIKGYFPEWSDRIDLFAQSLDEAVTSAEALLKRYTGVETQKEFALAVKDHILAAWLFRRRSGATELSARDWAKVNLKPDKFAEWVLLSQPQMV